MFDQVSNKVQQSPFVRPPDSWGYTYDDTHGTLQVLAFNCLQSAFLTGIAP